MKSDLQRIPGVGPAMERFLLELGYRNVASLKGQDPQEMYDRSCLQRGVELDQCVLYVYRLCVYFAQTEHPDPQKLRWWYWKEKEQ